MNHTKTGILGVTLYADERDKDLYSLDMEKTEHVITALSAKFESDGLTGTALHEKLKTVCREAECVLPIMFMHSRDAMKPLLDALQKGDLSLPKL